MPRYTMSHWGTYEVDASPRAAEDLPSYSTTRTLADWPASTRTRS